MNIRKVVAIAAFLTAAAASLPAVAQTSRLYFAGYLGLNMTHDRDFSESTSGASGQLTFNNGPSFAGALGVRVNNNLRIESELSYRNASISSLQRGGASFGSGSELKSWMLLMNVYYDFNYNWHNIQPYVTAGIGFAHHDGSIDGAPGIPASSGTDTTFAYQAGTGLKYRMSPGMALTGGYRFIGTGDANVGNYDIGYHAHEIRMGLEYDLPVNWLK